MKDRPLPRGGRQRHMQLGGGGRPQLGYRRHARAPRLARQRGAPLHPALRMCLRAPGGSKGPTVTHGGSRARGGPKGPTEGPRTLRLFICIINRRRSTRTFYFFYFF
jgi:hypothetical protein